MQFDVITLFPEFFQSPGGPLGSGLMARAREKGLVSFAFHNPRDFATDKHRTVDDRPYGGGPGMVMLAQPSARALEAVGYRPGMKGPGRLIYLSPKGKRLTQPLARELAQESRLTLLCGRYEGIDARLEEIYPIEHISVGDFVLNGGEAAALCLVEAVSRLLPGFMGHEESGDEESFSRNLLEYPHFTRPETFQGISIPETLKSGDHGAIARWRRRQSLETTLRNRPDLLAGADLTADDLAHLATIRRLCLGRNLYCGLVHYPVQDKVKKTSTVSLTNLDIHDIARSSCTYGLGGYYVLTPLEDQKKLLAEILSHWTEGAGARSNPARKEALARVRSGSLIEDAVRDIAARTGEEPLLIATTAALPKKSPPSLGVEGLRGILSERPVLLLFGTGHGLAKEALKQCDYVLPPVRGGGRYNHLSVRAAAAILFDRILGDWD